MRTAAFIAALVAGVAAAPQAVTSDIAPKEQTPAGCQTSVSGTIQLSRQPINAKRDLVERQSTPLVIKLQNGVLTDAQGRTGYIADNNQFQFDGPAQAGAIYTAGWSVCQNGSLALGDSTVFYACLSGTFYNLYDENTAAQCSPVHLQTISDGSSKPANAAGDGQITAAQPAPGTHTVVCQIGDGQIQQDTCITTATAAVAEATDGQLSGEVAITQIGDGQIQAPTAVPAPPAQTTAPAPSAPVVQPPKISQISDGQIQAPTGNNATNPTMGTPTPVNNAPATTPANSAPASSFTGAAATPVYKAELLGLAAGIFALAAL